MALVRALAAQGERVGLIHLAQLKPLPDLERMLKDVRTIITLEDHVVLGGLGSLLQDRFPGRHILKLGWPVNFAGASGSDDDIRRAHALDLSSLTDALSLTHLERSLEC
jgi:transketolase C-terminal domain/subunit